jgi:dsDNA-binding SOS-regulon protein
VHLNTSWSSSNILTPNPQAPEEEKQEAIHYFLAANKLRIVNSFLAAT